MTPRHLIFLSYLRHDSQLRGDLVLKRCRLIQLASCEVPESTFLMNCWKVTLRYLPRSRFLMYDTSYHACLRNLPSQVFSSASCRVGWVGELAWEDCGMGGDNWVRNPLITDFNLNVVEVPKTSYAHSCFKSPAKVELHSHFLWVQAFS